MDIIFPDRTISAKDIDATEASLNIKFPLSLRNFYISHNGGRPTANLFQGQEECVVLVSEFLPLISDTRSPATASYLHLTQLQEVIPKEYFPFAVDPGGDYFLLDCSVPDGRVYLYQHDTFLGEPLLDLEVNFQEFICALQCEES